MPDRSMNQTIKWRVLALLSTLLLSLLQTPDCHAVLANAWHIPDNAGDLGFNMRKPEFEIGPSTTVTIYQGLQKYNNDFGTANQTGGTLHYKGLSQGVWNATNLQFYLNGGPSTNNQYWQASFSTATVGTNEVIQYYLYLTFDGVNGVQNTYLHAPVGTGDSGGATTASQSTAATSPFTIRNRPAWLFHSNNRVVNPGVDANSRNVEFSVKIGYIGEDNSLGSRWTDNARIYYTTDGSTPAGSLGFPSNATQVASLNLDHLENDASIAGNAMWWLGVVSNLPAF